MKQSTEYGSKKEREICKFEYSLVDVNVSTDGTAWKECPRRMGLNSFEPYLVENYFRVAKLYHTVSAK